MLVLPQHFRSIAPPCAKPPHPHDGLVAAQAQGLLVAKSEPSDSAPVSGAIWLFPRKACFRASQGGIVPAVSCYSCGTRWSPATTCTGGCSYIPAAKIEFPPKLLLTEPAI